MYKTRNTELPFIGNHLNVWCPSPPYVPYQRAYGYTGNAANWSPSTLAYQTDGELFAALCRTKYQRVLDGYAGGSTPGIFQAQGSEYFRSTERKRPIFNDCDHFRGRYTSLCYGALSPHARYPTLLIECYAYRDNPVASSVVPALEHHDGIDLNAARSRAWWEMQPRFEGELSMLNFIFEMKDFRDIARYGVDIFKRRTWLDIHRKRKSNKPALSNPSRLAAESILAYNFGIAPLINDLGAIIKQCRDIVRDAQQQFFEAGQDVQKSHYSETAFLEEVLVPSGGNYGTVRTTGTRTKTVFTATLEYRYNYSMRSQHDAFLKYWGLTGSFEALLNMVPFSFLLDYVVKISRALHAMETDPNVGLVPDQYCESLLTTHQVGQFVTGLSGCKYLVIDGQLVNGTSPQFTNGAETSRYTRWKTEPFRGLYVPKLSLPTGKQGLNILALLRTFL